MYIFWYVTQNNMSRTCGLPGHGKYDLKLTQTFVKQNSEKIAQYINATRYQQYSEHNSVGV